MQLELEEGREKERDDGRFRCKSHSITDIPQS